MLKTKSIYDDKTDDDGLRVLITRYWPRGVKKERVGLWLREIGPSPELIKAWKSGKIGWEEFERSYRAEFPKSMEKRAALEELKRIFKVETKSDITILCTCREDENCHRSIVRDLLRFKRQIF